MSTGNGPVRRRRIAGESTPAAEPVGGKRKLPKPAKKAPAAKEVPLKAAPKPAARKAPTRKAPTKKTTLAKPPVTKAPKMPVAPPKADTVVSPAGSPIEAPMPTPAAPVVAARQDLGKLIPVAVLALAAVVFGALFAIRGIGQYNDQRGIGDSNDAASAAASKAAETIFSYDYTTLPAHATRSKALMTPSFKKQFNTINSELTALATQTKAVILSQARNAAALPCGDQCSPDKASILVFIDQAKQNVDLKNPTVYANRMVVDMVKRNGVWLVNDIQAL